MSLLRLATVLVGVLYVSAFAVRQQKHGENDSIVGSAAFSIKSNHAGLRAALLCDFIENKKIASSTAPISAGSSNGQALIARANRQIQGFNSALKIVSTQRDNLGLTHIRMQQYHKGIPVLGSEIIAHINAKNELFAVSGKWAPTLSIDTGAKVTIQSARGFIDTTAMKMHFLQGPRKVIFNNRVAYESTVAGDKLSHKKFRYIIDAQSGQVLIKSSLIIDAAPGQVGMSAALDGQRLLGEDGNTVSVLGWHDANGNYYLSNKDSLWSVFNIRKNDFEQRSTASWAATDPAAFSLGHNIATVQTWIKNVLGRNSFDNAGSTIITNVHEGTNYVNAYWDGQQLYFGDGDGVEANHLTVLDIVGHEFGHALTQYTSNLDYAYEPGALNESYSDILGTIIEFSTEPNGKSSYPKATPGKADWLLGEDSWIASDALRDLRDPQRFGQPSYYQGSLWNAGNNDNGGVHTNSGVQNFAFYLLSEGGSGTNGGHSYSIAPLGINAARDIALYANMYYLTSTAQYRDSRDAWILAAATLNYDTTVVSDVWKAVGIAPLEKLLDASPLALDYGKAAVGYPDTLYVDVTNSGGASTTVSSLESSNPVFSVAMAVPFIVAAKNNVRIPFVYTPQGFGLDTGSVVITSDAKDHPTMSVALQGIGAHAAVAKISPLVINATLNTGDSLTKTIVVANQGEADLKINATVLMGNQQKALSTEIIPGIKNAAPSLTEKFAKTLKKVQQVGAAKRTVLPIPLGIKVLYVNAVLMDNETDQFTSQMRALDGMASFDQMLVTASTPSLSMLLGYDVVIVASNYGVADPVLLGNELADYVDAGGKVIIMGAAFYNQAPWAIAGRIALPQYMPIETGEMASGYSPTFVSHIINEGITTLTANVCLDSKNVTECGASLGVFGGDILVGAYNKNKPIVAINVFPVDGCWAGDLIPLTGNALYWVMSQNSWLSVNPARTIVNIQANTACTLSVKLNAERLFGGLYSGNVQISHNDPLVINPALIPCSLSVVGIPLFTVSTKALAFDTVWTNRTKAIAITLSNPGSMTTTVTNITFDNQAYSIVPSGLPFTIEPQRTVKLSVVFSPKTSGQLPGTLTFTTSADNGPQKQVSLSGIGILPPKISISPLNISATLDPAKTSTQTIRLTNKGAAAFHFSVQPIDSTVGTLGASALYGVFNDSIYRLDPQTGEFIGQPIIVRGMAIPAAISFDGQMLYVGAYDTTVVCINPFTGIKSSTIILQKGSRAFDIGVSDSLIAVSSRSDRTMYIYQKKTKKLIKTWNIPDEYSGIIAMYGCSGELLMTSSYMGIFSRFDVLTGEKKGDLPFGMGYQMFSYLAQSNLCIIGDIDRNDIIVVDAATGQGMSFLPMARRYTGICANEAGGSLPWIGLQIQSGIVKGGSSIDIPVVWNSFQVSSETCKGFIKITNSQGGAPGPYSVGCALSVNPKKLLTPPSKTLVFDTTWVGSVDTVGLRFYNSGSSSVEITNITASGTGFSFGAAFPLIIKPYYWTVVKAFYKPMVKGSSKGQLVIQSDAQDNPTVTIAVSGVSILPPKLTTSKTALVNTLIPGDTLATSVVLTNSGDAPYPFFLRSRTSKTSVSEPFMAQGATKATVFESAKGKIWEIDPIHGKRVGEVISLGLFSIPQQEHLAFDGDLLYWKADNDSIVYVVDPALHQIVRTLTLPGKSRVLGAFGVTTSSIVVLLLYSNKIVVFDKQTGEQTGEWNIPYNFGTPNDLCGGGNDGTIYLNTYDIVVQCDVATGTILSSFRTPSIRSIDYSTSANLFIGRSETVSYYLEPQSGAIVDSLPIAADSLGYFGDLACDEAGIEQSWMNIDSRIGIVPAHGSTTIKVSMDTRGLDEGIYVGSIDAIYTGKVNAMALAIGCTLTVVNAARLVINPASIDFGKVVVKAPKTMNFNIVNTGTISATISAASFDNSVFAVNAKNLVIPAKGTAKLPVIFTPTKVAAFTGNLTITSNALTSPTKAKVLGSGVAK